MDFVDHIEMIVGQAHRAPATDEEREAFRRERENTPTPPERDDARFDMLYCDTGWCRVNEFERGQTGECPGCGAHGQEIVRQR